MKILHGTFVTVVTTAMIYCAGNAVAGDWTHWRGPYFNGGTDATGLPAQWSTDEGVLWAASLPGSSSATPIILGKRVFVVSNDANLEKISAICLDRDSGKELWAKVLVEDGEANSRNDMGACSPVTDGMRVYFMFGNSSLFALDLNGNTVWSRNLNKEISPIAPGWGYAASPLIFKDRLYVSVVRGTIPPGMKYKDSNDVGSFLLCIDPATGADIWREHRPSDALEESHDSYASPIPFTSDGVDTIVVAGGDYLTGNDANTGKELWRQANNPDKRTRWRLIPSPVTVDDLVIGTQPRGGTVFAIDPGKKARMDYADTVWKLEGDHNDVPTPLYYKGRLYIVVDSGMERGLRCINPMTGKELWRGDLGGNSRFWSSPTGGDGKIYCVNEDGDVVTVAAGDTFQKLGTSRMGGNPTKSTVAIADDKLFIRTADKLYCVGS